MGRCEFWLRVSREKVKNMQTRKGNRDCRYELRCLCKSEEHFNFPIRIYLKPIKKVKSPRDEDVIFDDKTFLWDFSSRMGGERRLNDFHNVIKKLLFQQELNRCRLHLRTDKIKSLSCS